MQVFLDKRRIINTKIFNNRPQKPCIFKEQMSCTRLKATAIRSHPRLQSVMRYATRHGQSVGAYGCLYPLDAAGSEICGNVP